MNAPEDGLDRRPVVVAVAGPNGAGKTTFYYSHLQAAGLRFVNADLIARELGLDAYNAARVAAGIRDHLLAHRESFVFETVFSDPAGDKLRFLRQAAESGYNVVLCFIGIGSAAISEERVAIRVSQGGHDVPAEKLGERFPRVLANLKSALRELPNVRVFDNGDLRKPYRLVAVSRNGKIENLVRPIPKWLGGLLPKP
jgi:predicted ABC-type ATPase